MGVDVQESPSELEAKKITKPNTSGQPMSVSGAPAASAAGGGAKPTSSGRFTNLQSYLKANVPQEGQASLGSQIAGKVQETGQQLGGQIKESGEKFQAAQKAAMPDQAKVAGMLEQVKTDPTKVDVGQFGQLRDVQYQGPQALTGEAQLKSGVQGLQDVSKLAGTEAGRFQLLRQMFSKPQYTTGQQGLDVSLLQGSPEQLKQLGGTARTAAQTSKQLQAEQAKAQTGVLSGLSEAQKTRDVLRGGVEKEATGLGEELKRQADVTQEGSKAWEREQRQKAITSNLLAGKLSQEQYNQLLGGTTDLTEGTRLYGVSDLSKYFTPETMAATQQNVATPEQLARMQALGKLAGETAGTEGSKLYSAFSGLKPEEVGTFGKTGTINVERLLGDIASGKSDYNQTLGQTYSNIGGTVAMPGDWLRSMSTRSPEQNLSELIAERAANESGAYGQAAKDYYMQNYKADFDKAISNLQGITQHYGNVFDILEPQAAPTGGLQTQQSLADV